jgi:hypothetical protein
VTYNINENYSVYPQAGLKVENVVYQCLVPFPYIWASLGKILLDGTCLIMLPIVEFLVSEYQLPHAFQTN